MSRTGVRLTGIVLSSRKYATADGRAVHELLLTQEPPSLPALARREWDTSPASHQVAERIARQYREGHTATVTAHGWAVDLQRQLLVLKGVDHVEPTPHTPTEALPA